MNNLSYVKRHGSLHDVKRLLRFCVWNAQSVRNKTGILQDYLCQEKIDLCVATESWITHDRAAVRVVCTPPGYSFAGHCRCGRKGGGIAVLHRRPILLTKITEGEKTSFEFAEYIVTSGSDKLRLVVVYRIPYSPVHPIGVSTFLDEFADYLESTVLTPEPLLITGDINIHVDVPDDPDAIKFLDLLDFLGLAQHVKTPTHRCGHTLDLIITREIGTTPISDCYFSDQCTVLCDLTLHKPALAVKQVSYRKLKIIDISEFKSDLRESSLCRDAPQDLNKLVANYNSVCSGVMDKHAPIVKKTIVTRSRVPWFNDTITAAKRERRKYERIWRTTGLESDRLAFTKARNRVNHVIEEARRDYYTDFINENSTDQRRLYNAVNSLLSERNEKAVPPYPCAITLANDFGEFFYRKIVNIRVGLGTIVSRTDSDDCSSSTFKGTPFSKFNNIPLASVQKPITSAPSKSCASDPLPTSIVKQCVDELSPAISSIINLFL